MATELVLLTDGGDPGHPTAMPGMLLRRLLQAWCFQECYERRNGRDAAGNKTTFCSGGLFEYLRVVKPIEMV